jgi:hypothetical protein
MDTPTLRELRRLVPLAREAISRAGDLVEGQPGYDEAQQQEDVLEAEITGIAEMVWREPARSFRDILERAEIADFYAYRNQAGRLENLSAEFAGDRAMAHLLEAVLAVGRADACQCAKDVTAPTAGTETPVTRSTTAIQDKALEIGRCYALHDHAEEAAWSEAAKAEPEWAEKLEAVAEEAEKRAHALEDSLAKDRPTTLVDALIMVSWARTMVSSVATDPTDPQSERNLSGIRKALEGVARFLAADTSTRLDALGLAAWGDWAEIEREDA